MKIEKKYVCTFCEKSFIRKSWFDRHTCVKKTNFIQSHNIHTIMAHRLFNHWQLRTGLLRKSKEKTMEEFCKSPYFKAFKEVATFIYNQKFISGYRYVDWIYENKVPQVQWCREQTVDRFLDYQRRQEEPLKQIEATFTHIKSYCEEKKIPTSEFFKNITASQALNMIKLNRIMPWVLFSYEDAVENLLAKIDLDRETLYTLDDYINVAYWIKKVEDDKDSALFVNEKCKELFGHAVAA
jgi:hypothetical protein